MATIFCCFSARAFLSFAAADPPVRLRCRGASLCHVAGSVPDTLGPRRGPATCPSANHCRPGKTGRWLKFPSLPSPHSCSRWWRRCQDPD